MMARSTDTYQDEDGNVWAFDPPYDDFPDDYQYWPNECKNEHEARGG